MHVKTVLLGRWVFRFLRWPSISLFCTNNKSAKNKQDKFVEIIIPNKMFPNFKKY